MNTNTNFDILDQIDQNLRSIKSRTLNYDSSTNSSVYQPQLNLHPLSLDPIRLRQSKQDLIDDFKNLRQSLINFDRWILQPILPHSSSSDLEFKDTSDHQNSTIQTHPQFSRLFSLLRESSRAHHYLNHAQSEYKLAKEILIRRSQHHHFLSPQILNNSTPSSSTLHLIEHLVREQSLDAFPDSDNPNLLTIAGKVMVIDIEIEPETIDRTSQIKRCKFSYSFGGGEEEESKRDQDIDLELYEACQKLHSSSQPIDHHRDLRSCTSFVRLISQLRQLDELVQNQNHSLKHRLPPIDYFQRYRSIIRQYHQAFQQSQSRTSQDLRQLPIHGLPITSPTSFELKIIYHLPSTTLLKVKHWQDLLKLPNLDQARSMTINLSHHPQPDQHHRKTPSDPTPTLQTPSSLFTATLDPPLPVSRAIASELINVSRYPIETPDSNPKIITRNEEDIDQDLYLDDLLMIESMRTYSKPKLDPDQLESLLKNLLDQDRWRDDRFVQTFDDRPDMIFSSIKRIEEGDPNLGLLIDQVQFDDLDSLIRLIQICRRQSILNELFMSCFNPRHLSSNPTDASTQKLRPNVPLTLTELLSDQPPPVLPIELILCPTDHRMVIQFPSENFEVRSLTIEIDESFELTIHSSEPMIGSSDLRMSEGSDLKMSEDSDQKMSDGSDQKMIEDPDQKVTEGSDQKMSEASDQKMAEDSGQKLIKDSDQKMIDSSDQQTIHSTESHKRSLEERLSHILSLTRNIPIVIDRWLRSSFDLS